MSDLAQHDTAAALADFNRAKEAIFQSQLDALEDWLKGSPDLRATDHENKTILFHAVADGKHAAAEMLLQKGADPNLGISAPYRTLLEKAINNSDLAMVQLLLKYNADVNQRDCNGAISLHHAACKYQNEVVKILLEKGADVLAKTNNGWTPAGAARYIQEIDRPFKPQLDAVIRWLDTLETTKRTELEERMAAATEAEFMRQHKSLRSTGERFKMKI